MTTSLLELSEETGTLVLEELDFNIACGHSGHFRPEGKGLHDGDAEWICQAYHDCASITGDPNDRGPWIYPACDKWAQHVVGAYGRLWLCPRCGQADLTENMVVVLGPLHTN